MAPVKAPGHDQAYESADQHRNVDPVPVEHHKRSEHDRREQEAGSSLHANSPQLRELDERITALLTRTHRTEDL
ncbi:MAG: hypothetical protein LC808_30640 [Actinobacteria bacterium]|nr:hypothetical protein [Actinomycetota bacterium]